MSKETRPLLDDDTAEMIAIHAWSNGRREQIALWGTLHRDSRAAYIAAVHVTARQLVALGWNPPPATATDEE